MSGGELSHSVAPDSGGKPPSTARFGPCTPGFPSIIIAGASVDTVEDDGDVSAVFCAGRNRSIRRCSSEPVPGSKRA